MAERDLSEGAPHPAESQDWEPAPLVRRFGALVLDWLGCVLVSRLFADPLTQGWAPVLVLVGEYGFFLGLFGQTPGMALSRIKCVGFADGNPVGVPRALLRGVLLALVVPALIMDSDRRGLHDRAAGSVVVVLPEG
jgi:uncharacterized RDD family membrane protein YckC